jgi:hypothetical protein
MSNDNEKEPAKLFMPEWRSPVISPEKQEEAKQNMLRLVDSLRTAIDEGTIAGICVVAVRSTLVPEHAFAFMPVVATSLAAGMQMANFDLCNNAAKAIAEVRANAKKLMEGKPN